MRVWTLLLGILFLQTRVEATVCPELLQPHSALSPMGTLADGRRLVDIDDEGGLRRLELPAKLGELTNVPNLTVLVLAGNSGLDKDGTPLMKTRHNLGQVFGEYLSREFAPETASVVGFRAHDTVEIVFADGQRQQWHNEFKTEVPTYRTSSGEAFYFAHQFDRPVLMVQALDDYNTLGDFAIAVADALNVSAERIVLAHDDMDLPQGEIRFEHGQVQKYNGNRAIRSLVRNLAFKSFGDVRAWVERELPGAFDGVDVAGMEAAYRTAAHVRHERDTRYEEHALLNRERVRLALKPLIDAALAAVKARAQHMRQQSATAAGGARVGEVYRALADKTLTPEARAQLVAERDAIAQRTKPFQAEIKRLDKLVERFGGEILNVIDARLKFSRLRIGSGDSRSANDESRRAHVLGLYPESVFNDDLWRRVSLRDMFAR